MNKSILLANSIWFKKYKGVEILDNDLWITEQLKKENYSFEKPLSDNFLKQLIKLRAIVLDSLVSKEISSNYEKLNKFLSKAKYIPTISEKDGTTTSFWACKSNIENQILSEIAQDLVSLFTDNKIEHVKTCSNDECQYYFIDRSKNKSTKYCSTKCNNLIKVRRHRAK